jgi:hypothetical protein
MRVQRHNFRQTWHPVAIARLTAGVCLFVTLQSGIAAEDKKADREARRAELLEQRLEQERAGWQTEKTDLTQKLTDAQTASAALKTQSDKVTEDLTRSNGERASLQKKVADLQRQLAEAKTAADKQAESAKTESEALLRARQQERTAQNVRYDAQTAALATCSDKNQHLLQIGHELLQRYRDKGIVDVVRQDDPLLGFKDVDIFNQVQDYRDKIDAEALNPSAPVKQ